MSLINIAQLLGKVWYTLTAYVPRKLPATPAQYERFKNVLIYAFGLPDEAQTWIIVSGQITSHNPRRLRAPWGQIANAVKNGGVQKLARQMRADAEKPAREKLEASAKKQAEVMQKLDALLEPVMLSAVLADDVDSIDGIVAALMADHPDEGTHQEWAAFIKNIALQKNASRATQEAQNGQKAAPELPEADAEPGQRVSKGHA